MDNLLRDIANLLDLVEDKFEEYHSTLEEREWADFNDKFRGVRREIKSKLLNIDELIRWD